MTRFDDMKYKMSGKGDCIWKNIADGWYQIQQAETGHNDDAETDLCIKVPESSYRNDRKKRSRIDKNRKIMDNNPKNAVGCVQEFSEQKIP